jgi:DNA-directed RNA polymerase subunit beta
VQDVQCIYTNELDQGAYISQTLRTDETVDEFAARVAIYRMMRPGEPPTEDAVQALFQRLFYNADTYDLSRVGRMKFNAKVGRDGRPVPWCCPTKTSWPWSRSWWICATAGRSRRHRPPGQPPRALRGRTGREPVPHRSGAYRKGREGTSGPGRARALMPHDLINSKPISAALKEFFGASQLSQFMDQTNPLAEITHKRRVSALARAV